MLFFFLYAVTVRSHDLYHACPALVASQENVFEFAMLSTAGLLS